MQHLVNDIRAAIENGTHYTALGSALALPDICGKLEDRGGGVGVRYRRWFDENVGDRHGYIVSGGTRVQMTGVECYALRCAYLHGGEAEIDPDPDQRPHHVYQFVSFVPDFKPLPRMTLGVALLVDVEEFCEHMCLMVESWLDRTEGDAIIRASINELPMVLEIRPGVISMGLFTVGVARGENPELLARRPLRARP